MLWASGLALANVNIVALESSGLAALLGTEIFGRRICGLILGGCARELRASGLAHTGLSGRRICGTILCWSGDGSTMVSGCHGYVLSFWYVTSLFFQPAEVVNWMSEILTA